MSRWLAYILLGAAAVALAAAVYTGSFDAPPGPVIIGFAATALLVVSWTVAQWIHSLLAERAAQRVAAYASVPESLARRLLGDYPPYVVEAARDLASTGDPRAAALLIRAAERLMSARPAAWPEMAGAMVAALSSIGDAQALPLLLRLNSLPRAGEIDGLEAAIDSLRGSAALLRPAERPVSDPKLLRPAPAESAGTRLLRPSSEHSEAQQ